MVITDREMHFMQIAIAESRYGMEHNFGGPFGCIIVKDNKIIAKGFNRVASSNDPTAHAEVVAIREACSVLKTFQLTGCEIYTSCEPCPMCIGAIYWARPDIVYYANTKKDAADIGFDDQFIYDELALPMHERKLPIVPIRISEAVKVFHEWNTKQDKITY
jgi:tRNA(Arg) A34 adenosine deaminase TadA